jgi:large subunit ribosomal protein L10
MPMQKSEKLEVAKAYAKRFDDADASIFAEYRGLSAEDLAGFRRELRSVGCEFKIVKNRVTKFAVDATFPEKAEGIKSALKGPLGVVYIKNDLAGGAKAVVKFSKEKEEFFKVTGGVLEGSFISVAEIQKIASLPSKEVLMARIVGSLVTPHRNLLGVLNGVSSKLVRTIAAIRDAKK